MWGGWGEDTLTNHFQSDDQKVQKHPKNICNSRGDLLQVKTLPSAGNNSRASDIVGPNFENVRPISHYDRTRWPNMSQAHLEFSSSRCCQSMNYVRSNLSNVRPKGRFERTYVLWIKKNYFQHCFLAQPLGTAHLLLQFPDPIGESGSAVNFERNFKTPTWWEFVCYGFWVYFGSRPLSPKCWIQHVAFIWPPRATLFNSIQQCWILWPGLYELMKRCWKYSQRETPV